MSGTEADVDGLSTARDVYCGSSWADGILGCTYLSALEAVGWFSAPMNNVVTVVDGSAHPSELL